MVAIKPAVQLNDRCLQTSKHTNKKTASEIISDSCFFVVYEQYACKYYSKDIGAVLLSKV